MEKQERPYLNPNDLADFCADSLREMGCKLPDPEPTAPAEDMWAKPDPAPDGDKEAASEKMRLYDIRQRWLYRRYDIAREMLPYTAACGPIGLNGPEEAAAKAVAYADALIKQLRKEDDE